MNPSPSNEAGLPREEVQRRRVHTITDRFSLANTYLLEDDERLVVVDPGSELNVRLLQNYLVHFLRRPLSAIDLVVITQLYAGHTDGLDMLLSLCHAPLAAASAIQRLLHEPLPPKMPVSLSHLAGKVFPISLHHLDRFPTNYIERIKRVDLWLEHGMGLPNHPDWRVIASPGYTPESICLYNPFTLELLCSDTIITTQNGSLLLRLGINKREIQETLRQLRTLRIHYLYPGHGRAIVGRRPLSNIEFDW